MSYIPPSIPFRPGPFPPGIHRECCVHDCTSSAIGTMCESHSRQYKGLMNIKQLCGSGSEATLSPCDAERIQKLEERLETKSHPRRKWEAANRKTLTELIKGNKEGKLNTVGEEMLNKLMAEAQKHKVCLDLLGQELNITEEKLYSRAVIDAFDHYWNTPFHIPPRMAKGEKLWLMTDEGEVVLDEQDVNNLHEILRKFKRPEFKDPMQKVADRKSDVKVRGDSLAHLDAEVYRRLGLSHSDSGGVALFKKKSVFKKWLLKAWRDFWEYYFP